VVAGSCLCSILRSDELGLTFPLSSSLTKRIGQRLSLAKIHILGADAVAKVEDNMDGRVNASVRTARRGRRTWHVQKLFGREPGDLHRRPR
jgi:hypothetical protein